MALSRRTSRPRFLLLLLALSSVTVITLDHRSTGGGVLESVRGAARDGLAPVEDAADAALDPLRDLVGGIVDHGRLEAENERLREQLAAARTQTAKAADAERERQALADLQDIDVVGDIPSVAARVVSGAASNFELTVVIDKGTAAGVAKGMPVVAAAGLVGRVVDVSRTRATVLLVTDPESSVGVRLSRSGDVGVAQGRGLRKPLTVDLIDPRTHVASREVLVTSGLQQSVFPAGIPIGFVHRARSRPGGLQQDVQMTPLVDLRRLVFVRVLQWAAP